MLTAELPTQSATELNVMGTRCRTIVPGSRTEGKLAIIHVQIDQPGTGVPEHVHDLEDEKFRVLEGKVRFTLGTREVIVNAGESIVGERGIPHSWVAIEPSTIIVSVTPSGLDDLFIELDALGAEQADLAQVCLVCERYGIHFTRQGTTKIR